MRSRVSLESASASSAADSAPGEPGALSSRRDTAWRTGFMRALNRASRDRGLIAIIGAVKCTNGLGNSLIGGRLAEIIRAFPQGE